MKETVKDRRCKLESNLYQCEEYDNGTMYMGNLAGRI